MNDSGRCYEKKTRKYNKKITVDDISLIPPSLFTCTVTQRQFQMKIGIFSIYKCPTCRKSGIKEDYKFCPYCGIRIKFDVKEKENV